MNRPRPAKARVFIDADVLLAGAAAPREHNASLILLRMAEISLIEAVSSQAAILEAEWELAARLPKTLPAFRLLVSRCLQPIPAPEPHELETFAGLAAPPELPVLVAALRSGCRWLATFNVRYFQPGHPEVLALSPDDLVLQLRERLAELREA